MEAFYTDDGSVAKFIHDDGSETAVKVVNSCSNFRDGEGRVHTKLVDRNKYVVFISASLGCYMACPFCHLTIKGSQYRKLHTAQVVANVKEAVLAEMARKPEMAQRYVKLCWRGMGDAISQPELVHDATLELMDWLLSNRFAQGLDCVDLSTVLPGVQDRWAPIFVALNQALEKYPLNPDSFQMEQAEFSTHCTYENRSRFRLCYSLHSAVQETRDKLVPRALALQSALPKLKDFAPRGPNLLLHQLFVEGLNDTPEEVAALLELLATWLPQQELRVLRYNFCDRSPYREWDRVDDAVAQIASQHARLKVQISSGSEVAAACGQFLVDRPQSLKRW